LSHGGLANVANVVTCWFSVRPTLSTFSTTTNVEVDSPFTRPTAHAIAEVVAAIYIFALGRPVNLPPTIWPAQDD
jgi:hypothetical protein